MAQCGAGFCTKENDPLIIVYLELVPFFPSESTEAPHFKFTVQNDLFFTPSSLLYPRT